MENNPYSSPQSIPDSTTVSPQGSLFKAWIVFCILSVVGGLVAGAVAGGFLGGILGVSGVSLEQIRLYSSVLGFVVSLPVSYLSFHFSVKTFVLRRR